MTEHGGSRRALIVLDVVAGVASLIGATMALTGWPYRAPESWLAGTPFSDYTVPGLILGVVVGGSALVAAWATIRSAAAGAVASLIAGGAMMGWLVGEWNSSPPSGSTSGTSGRASRTWRGSSRSTSRSAWRCACSRSGWCPAAGAGCRGPRTSRRGPLPRPRAGRRRDSGPPNESCRDNALGSFSSSWSAMTCRWTPAGSVCWMASALTPVKQVLSALQERINVPS